MHLTIGPNGTEFTHHGDSSGVVRITPAPVYQRVTCKTCGGRGAVDNDANESARSCWTCSGKGHVPGTEPEHCEPGQVVITGDDLLAFAFQFLMNEQEREFHQQVEHLKTFAKTNPRGALGALRGRV